MLVFWCLLLLLILLDQFITELWQEKEEVEILAEEIKYPHRLSNNTIIIRYKITQKQHNNKSLFKCLYNISVRSKCHFSRPRSVSVLSVCSVRPYALYIFESGLRKNVNETDHRQGWIEKNGSRGCKLSSPLWSVS